MIQLKLWLSQLIGFADTILLNELLDLMSNVGMNSEGTM